MYMDFILFLERMLELIDDDISLVKEELQIKLDELKKLEEMHEYMEYINNPYDESDTEYED